MLLRGSEDSGFFEHDDSAGFEGGSGDAGGAHRLKSAQTKTRDIEPEILAGLDRFDEQGLVGLEGAGAGEHGVGALVGLDGENGTFANDAPLADIEPGAFAGDLDTVIDVVLLDGKTASGHAAGGGELVVKEGAGVEQRDADTRDFLGDGAKNGFGVAALERGEDADGFKVGVKAVEKLPRRNLAGHDGVGGTEIFEGAEHFPDLADENFALLVGSERGDELGGGFFFERDQTQGNPGAADGVRDKLRVDALAGDQGNGAGSVEIGRKKIG